jgi:hypothetical protein
MHIAATFVVEAHLAELQAEAAARRIAKQGGRGRISRLITTARASLATRPEPFLPRLESYPYSK